MARTLEPKTSAGERRKRRREESVADAAGAAAAERAASDAPASEPTRRRPLSTSGGAFARCVLAVVQSIPRGRVAAYSQVAALAGAPRNARQVGHLLKEGLCVGGSAPWHRVIGASGRISLPAACGGEEQRRRLEAEGVRFGESSVVASEHWWERSRPMYEL